MKNPRTEVKVLAKKAKTADHYKTLYNEAQGRLSDMAKTSRTWRESYNALVQESDQALSIALAEYDQLKRSSFKAESKLSRAKYELSQECEQLKERLSFQNNLNLQLVEENDELVKAHRRRRTYCRVIFAVVWGLASVAVYYFTATM